MHIACIFFITKKNINVLQNKKAIVLLKYMSVLTGILVQ